jgi:8-oxo-dGTP diphosphatase
MPHIHCHVFVADEHEGEAIETDEAVPLWTRIDRIPYHEMWEDDIHWLPRMLDGGSFFGRFVFAGERLVAQEITWDVEFD